MRPLLQNLPRMWFLPRLALPLLPLLPLAALYRGMVAARRRLYRWGLFASETLPVPVIVVGNLTVGGAGKTPLVLWLVEQLKTAGYRPGVISRGYGAALKTSCGALEVLPDSPAAQVGDEPLILARRARVPVFVGRDRAAVGKCLLKSHPECNLLVADDGLQHYALARSAEIAVFDARGVGNGYPLPAGPLREPLSRLSRVTAVVWNTCDAPWSLSVPSFSMRLVGERFYRLDDPGARCSASHLGGRTLYAVAGTGNPSRFFEHLTALGLSFTARPFPDHHPYTAEDFSFAQNGVVLMTEKDAVKCAGLRLGETWVLPITAQLAPARDGSSLFDVLMEKLNGSSLT